MPRARMSASVNASRVLPGLGPLGCLVRACVPAPGSAGRRGVLVWQCVTVGDHGAQTVSSSLPSPLPSSPAARCLPDVSHFLPGSVQCMCVFILDSPLHNNHFKKSFS